MPVRAVASGVPHAPRGREWAVPAVFPASLAVVLHVAAGGRR
jgi:hypothetical protein